ncbi:MAG: DUF5686 family protein [Flavobacteriales bacterium]
MNAARPFLALVFLVCACTAAAQFTVQGRVIDERSNEPLAFVHVVPEGQREGGTTDIDGRFSLEVPSAPVLLRFSYVGYKPTEVVAQAGQALVVRMERATYELRTVEVLPGENPAHRIIKQVLANRKVNDGLRNRAHRYTSYSKTVFTAALDSAMINDPEKLASLDSSDKEAYDWLEKQHLLLIESATKRTFVPPASEKEEVLAMRVSGLKDPSLLGLAASTKTFSVYEPQIALGEKTYLSPIGPGSTERYLFILEDTLYQGVDTVFIISYQPRSGRKFDALKGVLYVNTDGYALQNVIAEPVERTGNVSVKLQQQFSKVGGKAWFPVQLNTFLYFDGITVNKFKVVGIGRTYLKDIRLDEPIAKREVRGPEFVMERVAARRDDAFWDSLRTDPLEGKELRTYVAIDSISESQNIERKVRWLGYLSSGRAGLGPVDLLLDKVFGYNAYEGVRLGAGLATNDKVSRYFSVGGYGAYGFADKAWKYGADLTLKPAPGRGPVLRSYYALDVEESGGVRFPGPQRPFSSESYRLVFMDRMDAIERAGAELAFRVNSSLRMWVGTERADRRNLIGYRYAQPSTDAITLLNDRFVTGSFSVGLRFAFREQVARLPDRQFGLGTRWPVLHVHAMRAVQGLWQGELDLWRVNVMVEKTFRLRMLGDLSIRSMAGMADPTAPYPFLYNMRGTFDRNVPVAAQYTFETMRPNEFLADRYVTLHLRHSFGNLLFKGKKFRPVPIVVANAAWGALDSPELHRGYIFSALGAGYYEAGFQLDNLLRSGFTGLGVGAFYRLGPNSLPDAWDNLALKVTLGLGR